MVEFGGLHGPWFAFLDIWSFYGYLIKWRCLFSDSSLKEMSMSWPCALRGGFAGRRSCSGWVEPIAIPSPQQGTWRYFSQLSPSMVTVWGWNFWVMHRTTSLPYQLQEFSSHFGYESTGKLMRLSSFIAIQEAIFSQWLGTINYNNQYK